jgi:hypothetical protein
MGNFKLLSLTLARIPRDRSLSAMTEPELGESADGPGCYVASRPRALGLGAYGNKKRQSGVSGETD